VKAAKAELKKKKGFDQQALDDAVAAADAVQAEMAALAKALRQAEQSEHTINAPLLARAAAALDQLGPELKAMQKTIAVERKSLGKKMKKQKKKKKADKDQDAEDEEAPEQYPV